MSDQIDVFRKWESELGRGVLDEADRLAKAVVDPNTADTEICWKATWNKPLYANTRVATGAKQEAAIAGLMVGTWNHLGVDPALFVVSHLGGNNARNNFVVEGATAERLVDAGIARHRMHAIQGAASLMRWLVEQNGKAPFAPLATRPLVELVPWLQDKLGRGWGHITVLHLLTDLGLAVKPDRHLVRAVTMLGLLTDMPERKVPNRRDAIRINSAVCNLADGLAHGRATPSQLRYVDKLLMEASRQSLFIKPYRAPLTCQGYN